MPKYKTTIETQEESRLRVTWEDDNGNVIVSGEKKVKGGQGEAKKLEKAFANDLKKNFAERFPAPIVPPGLEDELEGGGA